MTLTAHIQQVVPQWHSVAPAYPLNPLDTWIFFGRLPALAHLDVTNMGMDNLQQGTEMNGRPSPTVELYAFLQQIVLPAHLQSIVRIQKTSTGKPYLPSTNQHISISHTAVAYALAIAPMPCGIDIEAIAPAKITPSLIKYCCTPQEVAYLENCNEKYAFFTLWTAKEAVMKIMGVWPGSTPASIEVLPRKNHTPLQGPFVYHCTHHQHALSLALQSRSPSIIHFVQMDLPTKKLKGLEKRY